MYSNRVKSCLANTATEGHLALIARGRSIVHFILSFDTRRCKFRLLDGLLTLSAHHTVVNARMFQK